MSGNVLRRCAWEVRQAGPLAAVLAAFLWVLAAPCSTAASGLVLEEIRRVPLPKELTNVSDLRVESEQTLVVTARGVGVARLSYVQGELGKPQLLVPEGTTAGIVIAEHLGVSDDFLVVASPFSQLLWQEMRGAGENAEPESGGLGTWVTPDEAPISFFEDVDVNGERLAVLGLMRSETGMSPDGAIAWFFDLATSPTTPHPFAYARAGKGGRPFNACVDFSIGKVRFLADGSLLLVPGAEPGIYLYSPQGKLQRTWDTQSLGLDLRCDFDDETLMFFSSDIHARLAYINRFSTVDEILPTAPRPALLLRSVGDNGTRWTMVLLADDGTTRSVEVPISSPSRHARLRGDVLGDSILLVLVHPTWDRDGGKPRPADLIEMRLRSGTEKPEGKPAE